MVMSQIQHYIKSRSRSSLLSCNYSFVHASPFSFSWQMFTYTKSHVPQRRACFSFFKPKRKEKTVASFNLLHLSFHLVDMCIPFEGNRRFMCTVLRCQSIPEAMVLIVSHLLFLLFFFFLSDILTYGGVILEMGLCAAFICRKAKSANPDLHKGSALN